MPSLGLGLGLHKARVLGPVFDPARFVVRLNTNLRAGSTTVLIPVNARSGGDRTIDWGDGTVTVENAANPTHTYAADGIYTVQMHGGTTTRLGNTAASPNAGWTQTLVEVVQWGKAVGWTSFLDGFRSCEQNFGLPSDFPRVADGYAANVTNLQTAFQGAAAFNQPIVSWNISAVTNLNRIFNGCTSFNQPIGGWDTSSVQNMAGVFLACTSFNQPIGGWDTSSANTMLQMFSGAAAFNQDISGWDTANVNVMDQMFLNATAFNQDISGWNVSAVSNMSSMFLNAAAFNQDIGAWVLRAAGVSLVGMLNSSGLSTENYSRTLIGWANSVSANGNLPSAVTLGAGGRTYNNTNYGGTTYTDAVAARAYLTGASPDPAWTISDGGQV
jgi:surface protein